jgi:NAD(P)-dependent dehydrogenase (short-subunit alcohol dehydrogenase family)
MDFHFENELKDKIALVTGGSKGAGKAIADRLLQAGATVIITARNKPEEENVNIHFIAADLSKPEGTQKVVNQNWLASWFLQGQLTSPAPNM